MNPRSLAKTLLDTVAKEARPMVQKWWILSKENAALIYVNSLLFFGEFWWIFILLYSYIYICFVFWGHTHT